MEIKNQYILTELGLIPQDWELVKLNDCLDLLTDFEANGSFESVAKNVNIYDTEEFAWYVRATDLEKKSELNDVKFVDEGSYKFLKKTKLNGGEVLITKRGEIGKVYHFHMKTPHATLAPNMYLLKLNSKVNPYYLYSYFKASVGNKQLVKKNASSTLGALYKDDVKSINIAIPSSKLEQTAISDALSVTDELIYSLEKLIDKKKNIKQGAMQQLLKPKDGWDCFNLDKIVWFQEGPGVRNYQFKKNGIKLLNGTNIEKGKLLLDKTDRYISEDEAFGAYSHFLADEGDIIIACSGVTINKFEEKVTFVMKEHLPLCMNTSTMRFKIINDRIDKYFFFHFLKSDSFKEQIGGKATGSAQLNFGPSHVNNVQVFLPSLIEQIEIATILSDIDNEISALEKKLAKTILIKQGMMQNLLTGKIRLV